MSGVEGKWRLIDTSVTGLEEFQKAFVEKIPQETHHTAEWKNEGDGKWTQTHLFGNNFLTAMWLMDYGPTPFTSGEEFKHKDLSGSDTKSTITVEDNKVTQDQYVGIEFPAGQEVLLRTVREFNGDNMTTTISAPDVTDKKIVAEFTRA